MIYYGLLHSLFPCIHQSKEIIANFIVIYQSSDCMHRSKHSSMHMCMVIIQEIEHRVISSLHFSMSQLILGVVKKKSIIFA